MNSDNSIFSSESSPIQNAYDISKIDILDDEGHRRFTFGFMVTLFFAGGHTPEKRQALNTVLFDYARRFDGALTHTYNFASRRINKKLSSDSARYFSDAVAEFDESDVYVVAAARLEKPGDLGVPTPFFIQGAASDVLTKVSSVDAYFPADWLALNGDDALTQLVLAWCAILRPLHGTAGFGVIFPPAEGRGAETEHAFPFLKRFPGLDCDNSLKWRIWTERYGTDFIRSTNWLSVIDDARLARIGGPEALRAKFGPACPMLEYDGGVVIQAGPRPELGDMNHGLVPEHYRTVARTLAPLRFENYAFSLFEAPSPLDSRDETVKWIKRFD